MASEKAGTAGEFLEVEVKIYTPSLVAGMDHKTVESLTAVQAVLEKLTVQREEWATDCTDNKFTGQPGM